MGLPSRAELSSLGPRGLQPVRLRIPDATMGISVAELSDDDAQRLRRIYATLLGLREALRGIQPETVAVDEVSAALPDLGTARLFDDAAALGRAMAERGASPRMRKALHDLRGGSLQALLMHLELLHAGAASALDLIRVFLLARDQLKIMRNAVPDLDPAGYRADLSEQMHSTSLVRDKWASVGYRLPGRQVEVELDCDFEGSIASCCVEFSTLDRIVYNLVNNAAEHAVDGRVGLSLAPMSGEPDTLLRIAVANRISASQHARIVERFGDELGSIFGGGFTTGGHGLGLRICGELVAHGFSLPSVEAAVERGLLGARLLGEAFVVWIGWPARSAGVRAEPQSPAGPTSSDPLVRAERRAI